MQFLCSRPQALKVTVSILLTARTRRQHSSVHTCICRMCFRVSLCLLLPKFSRRDATFAAVRPGMYYTRYFKDNHLRKAENSGLKTCSKTRGCVTWAMLYPSGSCADRGSKTRGPLYTANGLQLTPDFLYTLLTVKAVSFLFVNASRTRPENYHKHRRSDLHRLWTCECRFQCYLNFVAPWAPQQTLSPR
jgi:hypothetical protein